MNGRIILLALLGSACGLPAGHEYAETPHTETVIVGGRTQHMVAEEWAEQKMVYAPARRVWAEMPGVLEELGIPVIGFERETGLFISDRFQPTEIGGSRLSLFLDCGGSHTAVAYADSYRVTMVIQVKVTEDPRGGALVENLIEAVARPKAGSGVGMTCSSTGRLLTRITDLLEERMGIRAPLP